MIKMKLNCTDNQIQKLTIKSYLCIQISIMKSSISSYNMPMLTLKGALHRENYAGANCEVDVGKYTIIR